MTSLGDADVAGDPTVHHTRNGPSRLRGTGSIAVAGSIAVGGAIADGGAIANTSHIADGSPADRPGGIHAPTYVVWGERHEAAPALRTPLVDGIRAGGAEVEQLVVPGCSHPPAWAPPAAGHAAVHAWLRCQD